MRSRRIVPRGLRVATRTHVVKGFHKVSIQASFIAKPSTQPLTRPPPRANNLLEAIKQSVGALLSASRFSRVKALSAWLRNILARALARGALGDTLGSQTQIGTARGPAGGLAPPRRACRTAEPMETQTHAPPIDRSRLLEGVKIYTYVVACNYEDEATPESYCLPSHASAWARSSRMRATYAADARVLSTI